MLSLFFQNFLNAAASLNNQFNNNGGNQNNNGGGGTDLSGLGNLLSGAGGDQNKGGTSNSGGTPDLSALGGLLGMIPQQEEKKAKLVDYIAPIVKAMSPKWGDVIIGILKNLELEKLLSITKDEKELEKVVREEEKKLERQSN